MPPTAFEPVIEDELFFVSSGNSRTTGLILITFYIGRPCISCIHYHQVCKNQHKKDGALCKIIHGFVIKRTAFLAFHPTSKKLYHILWLQSSLKKMPNLIYKFTCTQHSFYSSFLSEPLPIYTTSQFVLTHSWFNALTLDVHLNIAGTVQISWQRTKLGGCVLTAN